jgi:adenine/guanine phosphoribosyltransferase-like PRPP-binding protein
LALLVRRRYAREGRTLGDIAILTATRIGREFAARMPEAFPRSGFVFFDHHIIRPDKPRLVTPLIKQRSAVIIVDIVSTGGQVERLIRTCSLAGANVLAVLSICDFSDQRGNGSRRFDQDGRAIDHLTFWRSQQAIDEAQPEDQAVDPETLTLNRASTLEEDAALLLAELSTSEGLVYLSDADAVLAGHYELFGRHFEYVADVNRLLSNSSPVRGEVLRSCERALMRPESSPVAIVLYPDLSHTHLLIAELERQPRIRRALHNGRLTILEARRATRARGRRLWLTDREIEDAKRLASAQYPDGYALAIIDEVASSGQTLLGLLELARSFAPKELQTYVVVNRMTHVQTRHHVEIERFSWAEARFRSLIHLNIQGYSVETCPLCRERRELTRDANEAREAWFRSALHDRIQQLEVRTSAEETNVGSEFSELVKPSIEFPWERPPLNNRARTTLSYILSARIAINDGVPLRDILVAADNHSSFVVWREVLREVARRAELLQTQQAEDHVAEYFIRTIRHHDYTPRRVAALEIMRSMRREAVLPRLNEIITASLRRILDPEMKTELAILIKRFLDYRHGRANERFERVATIDQLIEQSSEAGEEESDSRLAEIVRLREEFSERLVHPEKDLPRIIRHLEGHLRTGWREHHQFIKVVREYVADREFAMTAGVRSAIDAAVVITYVAVKLTDALGAQFLLKDNSLPATARQAYQDAKRLREMVLARQRGMNQYPLRDIQEKLDALTMYLPLLQEEVAAQLVYIPQIVGEAVRKLTATEEARGIHVDIEYDPKPDAKRDIGTAIADNTLFDQILRDLFDNISRYAVEPERKRIQANIEIRRARDDDGRIELAITCATRDRSDQASLSRPLHTADPRHAVYGIIRSVDQRGRTDLTAPWQEVWSFWRL